ncbi:MAG TPA: energy-coupling factor transporter transmembrane component T [Candidatus Dormibacteraeota bacterium]|nr:energy-coupling factor transporter transmembrane component T [Candidatus Dormibacteraeota bacterium]
MARGLGLYVEGDSVLHRAHPLTKGALTLSAIALAFIVPSIAWVVGLLGWLVALAAAGGVLRRLLAVAAVVLLPIAALLLVVQGLVNPANSTVALAVGPFALYQEGLLIAALAALRIACLVVATFLLSFTTRPADLAEALVQRGLSPRMGYVLQSALQIVPQTLDTAGRIQDAQRARGLETEGTLPRRARAYLPLLLPLVLSSLVATQERAMALEVRGFGRRVRRISRHVFADSALQRVVRWAAALAVPAAIGLRLAGWR